MFLFTHTVMFTETINGKSFRHPKPVQLSCDEKTGVITWPQSQKVYFTPQKADIQDVVKACRISEVKA